MHHGRSRREMLAGAGAAFGAALAGPLLAGPRAAAAGDAPAPSAQTISAPNVALRILVIVPMPSSPVG